MPNDAIVLDGQQYLVKGPIVGKSIAEFTTGLKIGKVDYDDRTHAFFLVLDDFSGGFGHRFLDIREAGGTHWDNAGGLDLRRGRHVTLGPRITAVTANSSPTAAPIMHGNLTNAVCMTGLDSTRFPIFGNPDGYVYFGVGNGIYRMSYTRLSLTKVATMQNGEYVTRILQFTNDSAVTHLYAFGISTGAAVPYMRSSDPAIPAAVGSPTWTNASFTPIYDAIVWDDKLIGQNGLNIVYSIDGVNWNMQGTVDPYTHWRTKGLVTFVGIAFSPLVERPAVYFLDQGILHVLDFYGRKAYPIDVGDANNLIAAAVWNSTIVCTDGWNVWQYSPSEQETVRHIGLYGRDGVPPSLRDGNYRIKGFVDGGSTLYAIAERTENTDLYGFMVFAYNGAGWSRYGPAAEGGIGSTGEPVNPVAAVLDRFPIVGFPARTPTTNMLHVLCQGDLGGAVKVRDYYYTLPVMGDIPINGRDAFDSDHSYPSMETGWIDGGFHDIDGVLHYIKVDLISQATLGTGAVRIEYRLDNDEGAAYTLLGEITATSPDTLQFDPVHHAGVQFRTVQFRVSLNAGGIFETPELRALTLVYGKKGPLRTAWVAQLDLSRMIAEGMLIDTDLDGIPDTPATLRNVWQRLKDTWNEQTLVSLTVPNVEEGGPHEPEGSSVRAAQGTYIGDGTQNRMISTPRFRPKGIFIRPENAQAAALFTDTMSSARQVAGSASLTVSAVDLTDDGFSVSDVPADATRLNETGVRYHWWMVGGDLVATGTYTGTGALQTISDVGLDPELVIITSHPDVPPETETVWRALGMTLGTLGFGASGTLGGVIQSLGTDSFVVSAGNNYTNQAGSTYHWIAVAGATNFSVGGYIGDGTDNRDLPDAALHFEASVVHISSMTAGHISRFAIAYGTEGESLGYGTGGPVTNRIQDLHPEHGKFQVGSDVDVNANGAVYYYFAFGPLQGVPVQIADMPITIDDFRDAVEGKGQVDLTLLQPVYERLD